MVGSKVPLQKGTVTRQHRIGNARSAKVSRAGGARGIPELWQMRALGGALFFAAPGRTQGQSNNEQRTQAPKNVINAQEHRAGAAS